MFIFIYQSLNISEHCYDQVLCFISSALFCILLNFTVKQPKQLKTVSSEETMFYYHVQLSSKGDLQFSCAAAVRCVSVHRPPSESAEEHDVLHPVLLCHGSHVLHPLHVHGEPTNTQIATCDASE